MQIAGRSCEACGAALTRIGEGDGCGSCDVVVCSACLKGTARCPSCQRPFAQTRDEPPRALRRGDPRHARGRLQATAIAVIWMGAMVPVGRLQDVSGGRMLAGAVVLALLFVQLFRGRSWARWILAVLAALAVLGAGVRTIELAGSGPSWIPALVLALLFAWSALVLLRSEPLSRYLRAQRLRHP